MSRFRNPECSGLDVSAVSIVTDLRRAGFDTARSCSWRVGEFYVAIEPDEGEELSELHERFLRYALAQKELWQCFNVSECTFYWDPDKYNCKYLVVQVGGAAPFAGHRCEKKVETFSFHEFERSTGLLAWLRDHSMNRR